MLEIIFIFLPFIIIAACANHADKSKRWEVLTYIMLAGFCLLIVISGLFSLLAGSMQDVLIEQEVFAQGDLPVNLPVLGIIMLFTGIISPIFLIKNIREITANFLSINPNSAIHTTGLVFALIVTGLSFGVMFSIDFAALLVSSQQAQISEYDFLFQGILIVLLALTAVGIWTRRTPQQCLKRLSLEIPPPEHIIIAVLAVPAFFVIQALFGFIITILNPESLADIENITEIIFSTNSLMFAIIVSAAAGISEEILFRGALQPRFGILFTAFLFAVVHSHYPSLPAILQLFIFGILLGYLKEKTNTTACIITHFLYDLSAFLVLIYGT